MVLLDVVMKKVQTGQPILVKESLELLIAGNAAFVRQLVQKKVSLAKPTDYNMVLVSSTEPRTDATLLSDYLERKILSVQTPGNVIASDLDLGFMKLNNEGEVIVCGSLMCFVCDLKAQESSNRGISNSIDNLISHVEIGKKDSYAKDIYSANAINQVEKLRHNEILIPKKATITPVLADFTSESEPIRFLKAGKESENVDALKKSFSTRLVKAKLQNISLNIAYAHTVILSDPLDLGLVNNPRVIFDSNLNETVCISNFGKKVSTIAVAGLENALLKTHGVRDSPHIVILHTDSDVAKELKGQLLESKIVKEKTQNGKLITIMKFNRMNGQTFILS